MARVGGEELNQIKAMIKFGQRTPFRLLLTLFKIYRHRGLAMDPVYLLCRLIETVTKETWFDRTGVVPLLTYLPKTMASLRSFRACSRVLARLATPPVRLLNWLFESVDRRLHLSTSILPKAFDLWNLRVMRALKERAQMIRETSTSNRVPTP
jgi:hypothetical protein